MKRCRIVGSVSAFQGYVDWLRGAMMAPIGAVVMGLGEEVGAEERGYDLWTVGGS